MFWQGSGDDRGFESRMIRLRHYRYHRTCTRKAYSIERQHSFQNGTLTRLSKAVAMNDDYSVKRFFLGSTSAWYLVFSPRVRQSQPDNYCKLKVRPLLEHVSDLISNRILERMKLSSFSVSLTLGRSLASYDCHRTIP